MVRSTHAWRHAAFLAIVLAICLAPQAVLGRVPGVEPLKAPGRIAEGCTGSGDPGMPRLTAIIDDRGWLLGHRLELPRQSPEELGRIAFLDGPRDGRYVIGAAANGSSVLRVFEGASGCVTAHVLVPGLVFSAAVDPGGTWLYHDLVDPQTRVDLGIRRVRIGGSGGTEAVLGGIPPDHPASPTWINSFAWSPDGDLAVQACGALACVARMVDPANRLIGTIGSSKQGVMVALTKDQLLTLDGQCSGAPCGVTAFSRTAEPSASPIADPDGGVPVPESESDTWPSDALLEYRWSGSQPQDFMRPAINAAATDVNGSRASKAARFGYAANGKSTIGLSATLAGNCSRAIACAYRDIPNWWYIRLRPHRTEVIWGTIHWCEALREPRPGCYEVEHSMIHEFGHVEGLAHSDGLGLSAKQSVMDPALVPYPRKGWSMHHFGPCDQATLQRRYDVPSAHTEMALCNRLDTELSIHGSASTVDSGAPVTVTARLRVRDRAAYGRLGGNELSGRRVLIQRRPPGGSWVAYTAQEGAGAGSYSLTFRPTITYEFRAVFDRPAGDGLTAATSGSITVAVRRCTLPPCAVSAPEGIQ